MFKLFFGNPFQDLPLSVIILGAVIFVIIVVLLLFRNKSKRLFGTTSGVLAVVSAAVLLSSAFHSLNKPEKKPMSSTAMFKKMEYIEHLKLVSFYSEEVLVLGTKENVQRIVDNLEKEKNELEQKINLGEEKLTEIQGALDEIIIEMATNSDSLGQVITEIKKQRKAVKEFGKFNLKELSGKNTWINNDTLLVSMYASYEAAFHTFRTANDSLKNTIWRKIKPRKVRRDQRQALLTSIDSLKADVKQKHSLIQSRIELQLDIQQKLLAPLKTSEGEKNKELEADKKRHEEWIESSNRTLKKLRKDKQSLEERLDEANMELKFAMDAGEDIEPEVLIVAPAEIAVYINMKEVMIEEPEDSVGLVMIYFPPIEFDKALIELPDKEGVYDIDGKATELSSSQQGAYFDLFDQLKVTVLEKQAEVKAKAIENGIVKEGEKMAKVYLENFMRPLGIEFKVVPLREKGEEDEMDEINELLDISP